MRSTILFAALMVAACSKEQTLTPSAPTGSYSGAGRNALCIAGKGGAQRVGLIVYGTGDANCSASGKLEHGMLIPSGDSECRIPLSVNGDTVTIGAVPAACGYYCGDDKKLDGEAFKRSPRDLPVTDLAGDPLC